MQYITHLLAWRYIRGSKKPKSISIMLAICFMGIVIGSFSLALVLSIMNGFEHVAHEKLQSIHAQAIMRSYGNELNSSEISDILTREFPEVIGYSPTITKQCIIHSQAHDDTTHVVLLKGIDPERERTTTALETKIITAYHGLEQTLPALVMGNSIVIGKKLADDLAIAPGDNVTLLFAPENQPRKRKISFHEKTAVVGGVFDTGIEDFDASLVLCSLQLIASMWPESSATHINLKFSAGADQDAVIQKLKKRFDLEIYSWKDLYPALVSALKLEKYAMFFILALIILVASMNIISLQFMHITNKRSDIAILKSLGMTDSSIMQIFISIGMIITVLGSLTGLLCAGLAGLAIARYPFITLPDAYYVTHLPIHMELHLFAYVFFTVIALGLCATWIPAYRTRRITIAQTLRFDS